MIVLHPDVHRYAAHVGVSLATETFPSGYGRTRLGLEELFTVHHQTRMNAEYARRLAVWLVFCHSIGIDMGIGGSWRATGTQPDRPGFAPEGRSFHQSQRFADGHTSFCAVDLVVGRRLFKHRAPKWSEVPVQSTPVADAWGLHANVGVPGNGESWHLQPAEIDGWDTWNRGGRPSPRPDYPIAALIPPPAPKPQPPTPKDDDDMLNRETLTIRKHKSGALWLTTATSVQPIDQGQVLHYTNPANFDPPVPVTSCPDALHRRYSGQFPNDPAA